MARAPDHSHIPDWGVDLPRENRPAVPMERMPPRLEGVHWNTPEQQPQTVEILHTIERPGVTPVFGTSAPPSGVSGWLRRCAFRRSESDVGHWMLLLMADRVNAVEGLVEDAGKSRHRNAILAVGGVALAVWMMRRRR